MKNTLRQKKISWAILFSFFFCTSFSTQAQPSADTSFFGGLVRFYQARSGLVLKETPYRKMSSDDSAHIYVYVSNNKKVENTLKHAGYFLYCKHDLKKAQKLDSTYSNVNECFTFTTQTHGPMDMNTELLSYRKETQAYIVFHDLTHTLMSQMKTKPTYSIIEATCDVVANYLCREYALANKNVLNLRTVDAQIMLNENFYKSLNNLIAKINDGQGPKDVAIGMYNRDLTRFLKTADEYQKKRFSHKVNNGYLLKNSYNSLRYFDLKDLIVNGRTIDLAALSKTKFPQ